MRSRGLSFAETVVAVFLLAGAAMTCASLLVRGQMAQQRSLTIGRAASVADDTLEGLRGWAWRANNYETGWATYADWSFDSQGMQVHITTPAGLETAVSPSQALEADHAPNLRSLPEARKQVRIAVRWGSTDADQLVVHSWVAGPPRSVGAVQVARLSGSASPMAVNATAVYTARLMDGAGREIVGATFDWLALPSYGVGGPGQPSLDPTVDRSGRQVAMIHHFYAGDPTSLHIVPGWTVLRATCRYAGKELHGDSTPILLSP